MEMGIDTKKRVALQLLHFGLPRMLLARQAFEVAERSEVGALESLSSLFANKFCYINYYL
jgi:hypothetical protein